MIFSAMSLCHRHLYQSAGCCQIGSLTLIAFRVLDYLLLGTPAAPLYKALMDSGLGEAHIGHGLDTDMKQPFFSVGLKGVATTYGEKVSLKTCDNSRIQE